MEDNIDRGEEMEITEQKRNRMAQPILLIDRYSWVGDILMDHLFLPQLTGPSPDNFETAKGT